MFNNNDLINQKSDSEKKEREGTHCSCGCLPNAFHGIVMSWQPNLSC